MQFAFEVDWETFDSAGVAVTLQRWVAKKVLDMLGEEEAGLVEFVLGRLKASACPRKFPIAKLSLYEYQNHHLPHTREGKGY